MPAPADAAPAHPTRAPTEISIDTLARFDQALATIQEVLAPFAPMIADAPRRPLYEMQGLREATFRRPSGAPRQGE